MIKSIRGLKWFVGFVLMMSFCYAMDEHDPEFQTALQESLKSLPLEDQLVNIELLSKHNYVQALDDFLELVKRNYAENQKKCR